MKMTEINAIIKKQLPAEVGKALKEELAELTQLRKLVKEMEATAAKQDERIKELYALNNYHYAIKEREEKVVTDEEAIAASNSRLATQKQLVELKDKMLGERNSDLKEVVLSVFANNKFKYTENGMMPVSIGGGGGSCGYAQQEPHNKTVEGEA